MNSGLFTKRRNTTGRGESQIGVRAAASTQRFFHSSRSIWSSTKTTRTAAEATSRLGADKGKMFPSGSVPVDFACQKQRYRKAARIWRDPVGRLRERLVGKPSATRPPSRIRLDANAIING